MANNGIGASSFLDGFMRGYDFIDKMKQGQSERRRQAQLDTDNKQYRDATLDLLRQQVGLASAGTWSSPFEAQSDSTGRPGLATFNSRTGEVRGLQGYRAPAPEPKYGTTTYKDRGEEVTRRTVNGDPLGDPIGRSPIRQDVQETFSNPVDEVDPAGNPIRVQYGNRGSRRVIDGVKSTTAPATKPMPASVQKLEENDLESLNLASNSQADLLGFIQQIQGGDLQLGPVANVLNRARNATGVDVTAQSMNYASFRAALEKLRNDSLRLNKGVQTEGDSVRAWNELVANINDPAVVRQRLQEIANINARAMKFYEKRIGARRQAYKQEPLDVSAFSADRSAYLGGQAQEPPVNDTSSGDKDYSHLWE